ncbi:MAG: hypothetical protein RSP_17870 [Rhodanobacter sp.]
MSFLFHKSEPTPPVAPMVAVEEVWQRMALATLRNYLNDSNASWGASLFIHIARQLIDGAPTGTRSDRLRLLWQEKANACALCALREVIPMAHERDRLLGPVEPDRELTDAEKRERVNAIALAALDVIWDFITPNVEKLLAARCV